MLLPTEDLENTALRILLGDILADLILGNEAGGRVCEGWFLWECMSNLVDLVNKRNRAAEETLPPKENRLEKLHKDDNKTESRVSEWIWSLVQIIYWAFVAIRFVVNGLFNAASTTLSHPSMGPTDFVETNFPSSGVDKCPVLGYRVYGMLSRLLNVPGRMPWLGGSLALMQYMALEGPGRLGHAQGVLDR